MHAYTGQLVVTTQYYAFTSSTTISNTYDSSSDHLTTYTAQMEQWIALCKNVKLS